ncbi:hypothetical protein DTO217A2_1452 [Paecilomyces variotii]|nr:hypothetical protein DTO217A2_1452 [Paecilomyces variotii]
METARMFEQYLVDTSSRVDDFSSVPGDMGLPCNCIGISTETNRRSQRSFRDYRELGRSAECCWDPLFLARQFQSRHQPYPLSLP